MTGAVFLFAAVALSIVGSVSLWLMSRSPQKWDSGIEEFSRHMEALAPDSQETEDPPDTSRYRV